MQAWQFLVSVKKKKMQRRMHRIYVLASPSTELQWLAGLTLADQQLVVVNEADGALAPEASDHVDTHSILTHSRDFPALINI